MRALRESEAHGERRPPQRLVWYICYTERVLIFWTPDRSTPSGGTKQIYRHAELLLRAGIEARVLHTQRGFCQNWFEHQAPLAYLGESFSRRAHHRIGGSVRRWRPRLDLDLFEGRKIQLADGAGSYREYTLSHKDIVVMPEYLGAALADANIELPMVIFNQGWRGTFRGYGIGEHAAKTVYSRPNVLGAVAVSEYIRQYLEYAFEGLAVHRVVNGVDSSLFHPSDVPRHRQVAYMPRRMPLHLEQVFNLLMSRGALDGWDLVPIDGLSESGVAEILRHSFVFLSTCKEEGFGLPPVEAGMAGCLVVGYTGSGANEYFQAGLCERVDQDDVLGFAKAVERTLAWVEADESKAIEKGRAISTFLTERYSLEREAESAITAWQALVSKSSGPS